MANDLTAEFTAGREAALEGKGADACPYLATSDCADAWHAGRAFEAGAPTDFAPGKVTHGRGYLSSEQRERAQRMAAIRGWMDARPYAALSAEMVKRHGKGGERPTA